MKFSDFVSLLLFLPKASFARGIFFSNKISDSVLIFLFTLLTLFNGWIFAFSFDKIYQNSSDSINIFINSIYFIFGIPIFLKGIFPAFKPLSHLNKKVYPISILYLYFIDIIRELGNLFFILLILFIIIFTTFSNVFTLRDALIMVSFFYLSFHLNRSLRTIWSYRSIYISFFYFLAALCSILVFFYFAKDRLIINFILVFIITVFGYISFFKISVRWPVIDAKGKIKSIYKISVDRFPWILFFKDPKITTAITFFLAAKISFIIIFSSSISQFILGQKYFLVLSLMPVFLFNYLFNNVFSYSGKIYLNHILSPGYKDYILKSYGIFAFIVAIVDFGFGILCLGLIKYLKNESGGLLLKLFDAGYSYPTSIDVIIFYLSFFVFWYPISLFFSSNYPKNTEYQLFSGAHSNVWASLITVISGFFYAFLYFNLRSNGDLFYLTSIIVFIIGISFLIFINRKLLNKSKAISVLLESKNE